MTTDCTPLKNKRIKLNQNRCFATFPLPVGPWEVLLGGLHGKVSWQGWEQS